LDTTELQKQLKSHYLFSHLDSGQLQEILPKVRPVALAAGQRLFNHNDPADRFFLVLDGQIKLFRTTFDGQEKVVEVIQPGQTFAEAVMFMEQQSYPVCAEALKATQLLAVPNRVYLNLLRDNPQGCFRLLGNLSVRLHHRLAEIEDLTLQNATHRVVRYLIKQLPDGAANGTRLRLSAPKQVIASKLAIKPETFSRTLRTLSDAALISVEGRTIVINDVQALASSNWD
jgi:CRP/FNR family transcriptional regulator, dissimilatory nitrate respiration regulator